MANLPRRLLARLRDLMAREAVPLPALTHLIAAELVSEVCSLYVLRPGDVLELRATEGLRPEAVGQTRLRVGEGIIGLVAATGQPINLNDAPSHPSFVYRPETGEERYASMLAVPVRRAGHVLGVLAVQNRAHRNYDAEEVEVLETVAMLLAELLTAAGVTDGVAEGVSATVPRRFSGTALVPGIAVGPVVVLGSHRPPHRLLADDPAAEQERLSGAVDRMQRDLDELITTRMPDGDAPREVLEAYRLIAADAGWVRRISEAIGSGLTAEAATHRVLGELRDRMRRITDPYLRERLSDVEDLARRLLSALGGPGALTADIPDGAILIARRLGPAELLEWHARGIVGLVIEEASGNGHAALLARALSLPTLSGARGLLDAAENGDFAVLDADEDQFVLRPELEVRTAYARAIAALAERAAGWSLLRDQPTETADGLPVSLMLNMGLPLELPQLDATAADGIGLFRTEIAMMARGALVDQAEQVLIYRRVMDAAAGRQVLFRTLDLGGDKLLPGTPPQDEENPAMGWRSLRIGLDRPVVLRRQLRAMLIAAHGGALSVMFPMVATVAEFRAARALLLAEAGRVHPPPSRLSVGTMLEIPSLLWQLPALLGEVDFLSLGTNDLMQFLFAADRGTPGMAGRYDTLSPPVLDLLAAVSRAADTAGVPLSLCGEMASRPLEALALVGLGITRLSMPASALPAVKAQLAATDMVAFRDLLDTARLGAGGAASLRETLSSWVREHAAVV